jgi:tetratricopeptide (TPR) repeat protein
LAVRFVEGGYIKEAEAYLRQLSSAKVDNPMYKPVEALVLLGAILSDQERYEEAAAAFREALEHDPNHRQSHIEVAAVLTKLNQPAEAAKHYQAALERRENDPELRFKLAMSRISLGESEPALRELDKSIALRPSALAHHHKGNTLISLDRFSEAIASFEAALQLDSSLAASANNLAWILSTQDAVQDGPRAVELAEQLNSRPKARTAGNLDTLAAAYAAVGRFDEAVRSADEAVRLSKAEGDIGRARRIQKRLALYRQEKPFRE